MIATVAVSVLVAFLVLLGAGGVTFVVFRELKRGQEPREELPKSQKDEYLSLLAARVGEVEVICKGLPSLWAEERERAKQHADRAQTAYRGAEKILDSIAEAEASEGEDEDVYQLDEEGGDPEELRLMPQGVGPSAPGDDQNLKQRAAAALEYIRRVGI